MELLAYMVGAPLGVYVIFRLIFAAYFRAKQHHEDQHGQRTQPRPGPR